MGSIDAAGMGQLGALSQWAGVAAGLLGGLASAIGLAFALMPKG